MLHDTSRTYIRNMLQARLEELSARMATFADDNAEMIAATAAELRTVANSIADLMTHHLDAAPAEPVEQPRETRAALHLYHQVLKSGDTIRDLEVALGLSEHANQKPHNLVRDMREWVERERMHLENKAPGRVDHNGRSKRAAS